MPVLFLTTPRVTRGGWGQPPSRGQERCLSFSSGGLAAFAGFELGTGCHVSTLPPEDAAALLRDS